MAFTTNMSDTTALDSSIILAFDQSFIVANGQNNVMDQFVEYKAQIGAKSIQFPKYPRLSLATTPLVESNDVTSQALSDTAILLTPAEYGNVVTTTSLANLQTGGKADIAAARLVGINLGQTQDRLALLALDASTNVHFANGKTAATLATTDVTDGTQLNLMYNKLARASIPTIGGQYVMVAHDDVIADLRAATAVGSWVDVTKYSAPEETLKNEVGMYKGFRVVRDNLATVTPAGTSSFAVAGYNSYFLGANALGKAVSKEENLVISGPFDKLARFVNLGWYGVFSYNIIDTDCVWVGVSASSLGQ